MANKVELYGQQCEFDSEGYLADISQWDTEIRDWLAKQEGIDLSDEHRAVIGYMREYYEKYEDHPALHIITKVMGEMFGREKGNAKYLHTLFPAGLQQVDRLSGLPKRCGCC